MKKLLTVFLCMALVFCAPAAVYAQSAPVFWTDSTEEEIMNAVGVRFHVPAEAENLAYQIGGSAAQMRFTLNGVNYTARIQPTGSFENISDLEFDPWAIEADCMIGWCEARAMMTQQDDGIFALCLWYDAAPGLMYSVSACVDELRGLDIQRAAESVFEPLQHDVGAVTSEDILPVLIDCTGYAGSAGSSLKEAIAACRLMTFADTKQLAAADDTELYEAAAGALAGLTEEQRAELGGNIESINELLTAAFDDYLSVRDLFDTAGVAEMMDMIIAVGRMDHYSALYEQLLAAGLTIE